MNSSTVTTVFYPGRDIVLRSCGQAQDAELSLAAQNNLISEVQRTETIKRDEAVAAAVLEQCARSDLELSAARAAAEETHARELSTVLQEAHLRYRHENSVSANAKKDLEWANTVQEQVHSCVPQC